MGPQGYERGDLDRKAATIRMEIPGLLDPGVSRLAGSRVRAMIRANLVG